MRRSKAIAPGSGEPPALFGPNTANWPRFAQVRLRAGIKLRPPSLTRWRRAHGGDSEARPVFTGPRREAGAHHLRCQLRAWLDDLAPYQCKRIRGRSIQVLWRTLTPPSSMRSARKKNLDDKLQGRYIDAVLKEIQGQLPFRSEGCGRSQENNSMPSLIDIPAACPLGEETRSRLPRP